MCAHVYCACLLAMYVCAYSFLDWVCACVRVCALLMSFSRFSCNPIHIYKIRWVVRSYSVYLFALKLTYAHTHMHPLTRWYAQFTRSALECLYAVSHTATHTHKTNEHTLMRKWTELKSRSPRNTYLQWNTHTRAHTSTHSLMVHERSLFVHSLSLSHVWNVVFFFLSFVRSVFVENENKQT